MESNRLSHGCCYTTFLSLLKIISDFSFDNYLLICNLSIRLFQKWTFINLWQLSAFEHLVFM